MAALEEESIDYIPGHLVNDVAYISSHSIITIWLA